MTAHPHKPFPAATVMALSLAVLATDAALAYERGALKPELRCLALNIYHEARSESKRGQIAVAAVTLNRVKSDRFPNSVCAVVHQGGEKLHRCQFSWWCDGRSDQPKDQKAWRRAIQLARESLAGLHRDPTRGALYYHTTRVKPAWSKKFRRSARIGNHVFYRPKPRRSLRLASAR